MPPPTPYFSVVTTCRNGLAFLKETAASVLAQSFTDFEWVFVDDGSTEPVSEFIRSLNDPRIVLLRNEKSLGAAGGANRGIEAARGEWIARVDADDVWRPDHLERTRQAIVDYSKKNSRPPTLTFTDCNIIAEDGSHISTIRYKPVTQAFYEYLETKNCPVIHSTTSFPRYNHKSAPNLYNASLFIAVDYDLWRRMRKEDPHGGFCLVSHPTVSLRVQSTSLTALHHKEQVEQGRALKSSARVVARSTKDKKSPAINSYRTLFYKAIGTERNTPTIADVRLFLDAARDPSYTTRSAYFFVSMALKRLAPGFMPIRLYR